jgi:hypothetical protein
MSTPLTGIKCPNPKCDGTAEDLRLVFLMEMLFRIKGESPGELVVEAAHQAEPPGGPHPAFLCLECNTRWPLPKGVTVRATTGGQTTTIWDGRRR